jgi:hypothetical protein
VFAGLLRRLAEAYAEPSWAEAAVLFERSAVELEKATDVVVDYLLKKNRTLDTAASTIARIADVETQAFQMIRNCRTGGYTPAK